MIGTIQLLLLALAPVVIIAVYIYIRDKYEHEPIGLLLKTLLLGAVISIPVIFVEQLLSLPLLVLPQITHPAWNAFVIAAFTEESFKFLALYWLIWKNPNFNEKFDGIVYAVFISLGFAGVENVLYVYDYGVHTGIIRMFTAVPAHALFGIAMGFYFGLAKFYPHRRRRYLLLSLGIAIVLHGIYDYILMSTHTYLLAVFLIYLLWLWRFGFLKLRDLSNQSVFRNSFRLRKNPPPTTEE